MLLIISRGESFHRHHADAVLQRPRRLSRGVKRKRHQQKSYRSHVAPFLRHASARSRHQPATNSREPRPQLATDHRALYAPHRAGVPTNQRSHQQAHGGLMSATTNITSNSRTSFANMAPLLGKVRRAPAATSPHGHGKDYRLSHRSLPCRRPGNSAAKSFSASRARSIATVITPARIGIAPNVEMTKPTNGSRCKARCCCR